MWATVRYLPLGHHDAITPYVGGGVVIYNWRYSESGDFVTLTGLTSSTGRSPGRTQPSGRSFSAACVYRLESLVSAGKFGGRVAKATCQRTKASQARKSISADSIISSR